LRLLELATKNPKSYRRVFFLLLSIATSAVLAVPNLKYMLEFSSSYSSSTVVGHAVHLLNL